MKNQNPLHRHLHTMPAMEFLEPRMLFIAAVDSNWGSAGSVVAGPPLAEASASKILVQSDGKVVVAGATGNGANPDEVFVSRFDSVGNADNTFGSDGTVITSLPYQMVSVQSAQLTPDNKTVVLADVSTFLTGKHGTDNQVFASILLRYTATGQLDTTFGHGGEVTLPANRLVNAGGLIVDSQGQITVAGQHDLSAQVPDNSNAPSEFAVVRYTTAGHLDQSFGHGGILQKRIGFYDIAFAMTTANDGSLAIAGRAFTIQGDNLGQIAVLRLGANGKPDSLFGQKGAILAGMGAEGLGVSVAVTSSGDVVVVSGTEVTEYTADGAPDIHFGTGGVANVLVPHGFDSQSYYNDIASVASASNEIVVGGTDIEQLDSGGNPDTGFSSAGQIMPANTVVSLAVTATGAPSYYVYALERILSSANQFGIQRFVVELPESMPG